MRAYLFSYTTLWRRHILHYDVDIYYTMASAYTTLWRRHILHYGVGIYYDGLQDIIAG